MGSQRSTVKRGLSYAPRLWTNVTCLVAFRTTACILNSYEARCFH